MTFTSGMILTIVFTLGFLFLGWLVYEMKMESEEAKGKKKATLSIKNAGKIMNA